MAAAKDRLFWNADKSKLVHEDDPDASFLAAAVGDDIPEVEHAPAAKATDKMVRREAK